MSQFQDQPLPVETIAAAAKGDTAAYEAIYHAYKSSVYTLIRRLISRPAVADELFQEVCVEIFRSIATYSGDGPLGAWIRTITANKCLMYLRSPWHRSLLWLDAQSEDEGSIASTLVDNAARPENQASAQLDLERALAHLPALSRSVVWLHDVEGYTHEEIASALKRTPSFSKSQLARAHKRLRELLEQTAESLSCTPVSTNC